MFVKNCKFEKETCRQYSFTHTHTYRLNIGQNPNSSRNLTKYNYLEPADTNQIRIQAKL